MKYYVTPNASGSAGLIRLDETVSAPPKQNWIEITQSEHAAFTSAPRAIRIVNGVPTIPPPDPVRVIGRGAFMDRFTMTTQMALETIAEQQDVAGRTVRIFTRRLEAESTVHLDSEMLTSALDQIKAILMNAGVEGWTTKEDADASVAVILA